MSTPDEDDGGPFTVEAFQTVASRAWHAVRMNAKGEIVANALGKTKKEALDRLDQKPNREPSP